MNDNSPAFDLMDRVTLTNDVIHPRGFKPTLPAGLVGTVLARLEHVEGQPLEVDFGPGFGIKYVYPSRLAGPLPSYMDLDPGTLYVWDHFATLLRQAHESGSSAAD